MNWQGTAPFKTIFQSPLKKSNEMTEKEIIENIASKLGIASLNPMQVAMLGAAPLSTVLIAPTGSGKTIAFSAAMLRTMAAPSRQVQALVLAPSRELVLQIYSVVRPIAAGYKTVAIYGGHSFREEEASLSVTPDIVIATPGRLLDHIERKRIDLSVLRVLVIDEYDKLLELGFEDEMKRVAAMCRSVSTVFLTSATAIDPLPAFLHLKHPEIIRAENQTARKSRLQHILVESPLPDKIEILVDLLRSLPDGKAIVFVNYRDAAERVFKALKKAGLPAGLYHGGLEQPERELAVNLLNNGSTPILVATDLGARGLDIDAADYVIHYHLPSTSEAWTHRNGRTARQGADGSVYVIVSEADNIPEYVVTDRPYIPSGKNGNPIRPSTFTLYFNLGKKEKISRGDIAGFIAKAGSIDGADIGRINISDHASIAAVRAGAASPEALAAKLSEQRIKGKKVRVSHIYR